jgi:hypothetical protein
VRWPDRPLLLFHGDRDELLPMQSSEIVRMIAGAGELVVLPATVTSSGAATTS